MASSSSSPQQSLQSLYDDHARPCFALASHLLGDVGQAADVVHEAFLDLWHGQASAGADVGSWLAWQTHRRAVDRLRRNPHEDLSEHPTPRPAADELLTAELNALTRQLLGKIPGPERQCLVLAYWGGFTSQEIAVITGRPVDDVREFCRVALAQLFTLALHQRRPVKA